MFLISCVSTKPQEETKDYEIVSTEESFPYIDCKMSYPQFLDQSLSKLNSGIKSFAEKEYKMYKDEAKTEFTDPRNPAPRKYSYELTVLDVGKAKSMRSVILKTESYTGGAHYSQTLKSFNFDSSKEKEISVTAATGMSLKEISAEARKLLVSQGLDSGMVMEGTGPYEKNFSNFTISEKTVTIYFEPYQVASYADGIRKVTITRK